VRGHAQRHRERRRERHLHGQPQLRTQERVPQAAHGTPPRRGGSRAIHVSCRSHHPGERQGVPPHRARSGTASVLAAPLSTTPGSSSLPVRPARLMFTCHGVRVDRRTVTWPMVPYRGHCRPDHQA
jgi:hypothetical protein